MARSARRHGRSVAIAAMCAVLALSGCGGGAVSVRSNFSGPPLGPAPPAAPSPPAGTPKGLYATGDGDVLLAIIVAMMLFDGVSWVSQRLRQAYGDPEALPAAPAPPAREPVRRGPGASWVFSLP